MEAPVQRQDSSTPPATTDAGTFQLTSSAFAHGDAIPRRHSCDGDNVSPPLAFAKWPPAASHLALIMEDPDAPFGTVLHWTFWNLPVNATDLPVAADVKASGADEGRAYRGPCPPAGLHRYFFYAYATNGTVEADPEGGAAALRAALDGRTLARAEMYGTYFRPSLATGDDP